MIRFADSFRSFDSNIKWTTGGWNASQTGGRYGNGSIAGSIFTASKTLQWLPGQNLIVVAGAWFKASESFSVFRVDGSGEDPRENGQLYTIELARIGWSGAAGYAQNQYGGWVKVTELSVDHWATDSGVLGTPYCYPGSNPIPNDEWLYFELMIEFSVNMEMTISTYVDEYLLNVDTLPIGVGYNDETAPLTFPNPLNFTVYLGNGAFCDFMVIDNTLGPYGDSPNTTRLGDRVVNCYFPRADGTYQEWDPSSGSTGYTQVDDDTEPGSRPDGDNTYNSTNTPGDRNTYLFQPLSGIEEIDAVQICNAMRKEDAGGRVGAAYVKSGSTELTPDERYYLTTGYKIFHSILERDPNTGDKWEEADVNAAEFGEKLIT